jgi:hypothetical protein
MTDALGKELSRQAHTASAHSSLSAINISCLAINNSSYYLNNLQIIIEKDYCNLYGYR